MRRFLSWLVADVTADAHCQCYTLQMALSYSALLTVDKHIAGVLHRISRQRAVVEKLRGRHHDPSGAKRLLRAMERTLGEFQTYRRLIEDELMDSKESSQR
jgi:hypothetical protein